MDSARSLLEGQKHVLSALQREFKHVHRKGDLCCRSYHNRRLIPHGSQHHRLDLAVIDVILEYVVDLYAGNSICYYLFNLSCRCGDIYLSRNTKSWC
jgi:hypothetical protein